MSGPYAGFILGAYGVTALVLGALIIEAWRGLRRARARLRAAQSQGDEG